MKRFKFTIFLAAVFMLVFLSIQNSVTNADKITAASLEKKGAYTYITGNISPLRAYKGYEYTSSGEKCCIKIYSSLRLLGGSNEFKIHVGSFDKIYFTDGKNEKLVEVK